MIFRRALPALLSVVFFAAGCTSGVLNLGSIMLKDGTTMEYVQVGTKGQDGPKLVVIEGYRYDPAEKTSEKTSAYNAAGPSLTADILRGAASAGIIAGGAIGAAAVLKPAITKISQSGGGAAISGSGNSTNATTATGGEATTGAVTNTNTNRATGGKACNESGPGNLNDC